MNTQDKELLFKDLSMRLPYHVYIQAKGYSIPIELRHLSLDSIPNVKPYLRPMSSMTEEEEEEWNSYVHVPDGKSLRRTPYCIKYMDWLLEHHFDFRHLIEKGLALEALEWMYKIE